MSLKAKLEAIVYAAEAPVTLDQMVQLVKDSVIAENGQDNGPLDDAEAKSRVRCALEELIAVRGINGFYRAREARVACCDIRKVEPLTRALAGAQGWITGLRADQSADRAKINLIAVDRTHNLLKFNPLIDWSRQAAQDFAAAHEVPINPLYQKGFLSIGCAPCTRAVRPGEPERAGRWWWEDSSKRECGLHVAAGAAR